jgi:predicted metal-dependent hydrolase
MEPRRALPTSRAGTTPSSTPTGASTGATPKLAHVELDYTIRRSARARRVRVAVDPHAGVQVTLPARAREREAALAVAELRPWIERRLAEVRAARERLAVPAGHLPYLGAHLALSLEPGRVRAHRRGDVLHVPADDGRLAIERWYRRAARAEIAPRLDDAVTALGKAYTKLTIRGQRTRWGSCSTTGAMSFNWRLVLAPEEILDYVVWHEACHLVVMDHSPAFWSLLERHRPSYRTPQRWLRANGTALVLP